MNAIAIPVTGPYANPPIKAGKVEKSNFRNGGINGIGNSKICISTIDIPDSIPTLAINFGLRDVELASTTVPNWDTYDTVFIGYPIWWGIAAWPTDGFVKANDFTGKTVIPFCTSASSGIGDSGKLLEEEAGTGNWLDGMRFRSSASEDDVKSWVDGLEK